MKQLGKKRKEGAAYMEALIMLPVFFIIFAGYYLVYRAHMTKLTTLNQVRNTAWVEANKGCKESRNAAKIKEAKGKAEEYKIDAAIAGIKNISMLNTVLEESFGRIELHTASGEYKVPDLYGGGSRSSSTEYALMCNPKRVDFWDLLHKFFCDQVKIGGKSVCK